MQDEVRRIYLNTQALTMKQIGREKCFASMYRRGITATRNHRNNEAKGKKKAFCIEVYKE